MDAVVIGAGPNGLTAAAHLAKAGWSVLVLEAQPEPGGAVRTKELTLPGFRHDVGAGFFPFGTVSPALAPLRLDAVGLRFVGAPVDSAHPALDGTCPAIGRDFDDSRRSLGRDGDRWIELARWFRKVQDAALAAFLGPVSEIGPKLDLGVDGGLTFASIAVHSGRSFGLSRFETEAARRVVPGLCLHADVGPDDPMGAMIGFMLAALAASTGFVVPEGGAGAITKALVARIQSHGGEVRCGTHVDRIVVRDGRGVAVVTSSGEEIEAKRAILADVGAPALYLRMLDERHVPASLRGAMKRFPQGWGTFKVDWALDAPVPWTSAEARRAAVVHLGESVDDLARFTAEVRAGKLPSRPYACVGQQSLADRTRAPHGRHTLYAYTHVPSEIAGGWDDARERFADEVEAKIESLAPGFRKTILARSILAPPDLEAVDENLVGGDLGGGTSAITNQLFLRPAFPWSGAKTPVKRLYLASSYTHPGTGVHGACGWNAARAALRDAG